LFGIVVNEIFISELIINFRIVEILCEFFLGTFQFGSEFLGNIEET